MVIFPLEIPKDTVHRMSEQRKLIKRSLCLSHREQKDWEGKGPDESEHGGEMMGFRWTRCLLLLPVFSFCTEFGHILVPIPTELILGERQLRSHLKIEEGFLKG